MMKFRKMIYCSLIKVGLIPMACVAESKWTVKGSLIDYEGSGHGLELAYEFKDFRVSAMRAESEDNTDNKQRYSFVGLELDAYRKSDYFRPYIKFGVISSNEYRSLWRSSGDVVYQDYQRESNTGVGAGFGMNAFFKKHGRPFIFFEALKGHESSSLLALGFGYRFF